MQFKFESNQPFQLQAIESVARLFEGQHYVTGKLEFQYGAGLAIRAISNSLEVDDDAILQTKLADDTIG